MDGSQVTVSCREVWKVYGPKAESIVGSPDASLSRAELLEKTGCVAAVRDVSFDVAPGVVPSATAVLRLSRRCPTIARSARGEGVT